MDRATIITVAVTGNITRPDQHPDLPITPAQIATACLDSEAVAGRRSASGGRSFSIVGAAFLMGGHVRAGMEDNLYLARGQKTPGNAALVERAAAIVRSLGGTVASPDEARRFLGLAARPDADDRSVA